MPPSPHVAVFGSSSVREGSPDYDRAYRLGRLLAQAGFVVVNGGYIGTMEAVSKGAAEAGGHVIGVTCKAIERWRPVGPNPWLTEVWPAETLMDRLNLLLSRTQAAVVLPGGVGTLTEFFLFWNHLLIQAWPPRPLVLLGDVWTRWLPALFATFPEHFPEAARRIPQIAATPEAAVGILQTAFAKG